jgi:hypothetical protein
MNSMDNLILAIRNRYVSQGFGSNIANSDAYVVGYLNSFFGMIADSNKQVNLNNAINERTQELITLTQYDNWHKLYKNGHINVSFEEYINN